MLKKFFSITLFFVFAVTVFQIGNSNVVVAESSSKVSIDATHHTYYSLKDKKDIPAGSVEYYVLTDKIYKDAIYGDVYYVEVEKVMPKKSRVVTYIFTPKGSSFTIKNGNLERQYWRWYELWRDCASDSGDTVFTVEYLIYEKAKPYFR